tara:strand:- start:6363 stop:6587 length:225 start_codon:yes stop_codon:yes gene_type:complete
MPEVAQTVVESMSMTTKLILLAIALIVGALYYIYTNIQQFKGSVGILFQKMQNELDKVEIQEVEEEEEISSKEN